MDEPDATPPARGVSSVSRLLLLAPAWAIAVDQTGETWFDCGGPFGMSAPTAGSLADALAMGGMVVIMHLATAYPPRAATPGERRRRPWRLLGRRLRPTRKITLGNGLLIGVALVLLVWHFSVQGYERGLDRVERGECPAADATVGDR